MPLGVSLIDHLLDVPILSLIYLYPCNFPPLLISTGTPSLTGI
nr:MAG TPA: hypothetical protein [Caudoviricetes sp.]